jgi:hypothetical protein
VLDAAARVARRKALELFTEGDFALDAGLVRGYGALEEIRVLSHVLECHEVERVPRAVSLRDAKTKKALISYVFEVLADALQ